jgi:hypothetical protein
MSAASSTLLTPEITMAIVFGILLAEALAWFMMPRWYFSHGIPLFRSSAKVLNWPNEPEIGPLLEEHQPKSIFAPFKFKQFDRTLVGVRESSGISGFWKWHYSPVMRGVIKFDQLNRTISIHGYANYSILLLVPAATVHTLSRPMAWIEAAGVVLFIILIIGGIYLTQAIRYQKLLALSAFVRKA